MSSTDNTTTAEHTETNTNKEEENKQDTQNNNQTKPIKKVKSKKDLKNDPSRFDAPGVNFNAKLIGVDEVENARGDKMCQESIFRLKVAVKQSGQHKQKIIINVSVDGIRIIDVRTQTVNFTHPVHRISFISRDITDNRAFGYVYGAGEGKHKFFAIKTEKAAEALVLTLRDLFQVVYELKKQEVEDAKHKIEEPAPETAGEAKEGEPVYSEIEVKEKRQEKESVVTEVPSSKPVENSPEQTYEVPPNNQPVVTETRDLLNLESEMEAMEKRIEQIDTMEELFKELEAPPPAATSGSPSATFSSDLAGLSTSMSAPQPTFSMGGVPFGGNQQFGVNPFPGGGQPFGAPGMQGGQQFGAQPPVSQAFGQPGGGFGANFPPTQQQPGAFGAAPNPFGAPPSVPPRTSMGFPGQPAFPGTPFPSAQPTPGFPPSPQPQINVQQTPSSDPFGNDPFDTTGGFDDNVLMPARTEQPGNEPLTTKEEKKDVFGDLVSLEPKTNPTLKGKDMFVALNTPEKKSLNQMGKSPSPKPPSSPKASDDNDSFDSIHAASSEDPFGASIPFGTSDPFANDPFASCTPAPPSKPLNAQVNGDVTKDACNAQRNDPEADPYNIPLPQMPPPPLPQDVASHIKTEPIEGPPPPPRPNIPPPSMDPPSLPPIPPRPKSGASDSSRSSRSSTASSSSISDPGAVSHLHNPPLPPRPSVGNSSVVPSPRADSSSVTVPSQRTDYSSSLFSSPRIDSSSTTVSSTKGGNSCLTVPRPRPRASLSKLSADLTNTKNLNVSSKQNVIKNNVILGGDSHEQNVLKNDRISVSNNDQQFTNTFPHISAKTKTNTSPHISAKTERLNSTESHTSSISDSSRGSTQRSSSVVADPFVSEDPFRQHDPFTQTDPFANDPFATDPFSDISDNASNKTDDPFTTIIASPRTSDNTDPFSVFDNKILNDSFKFDRSSSKKGKSKVSG